MKQKPRHDSLLRVTPLLLLAAACSKKLDGPTPTVTAVDPQVVCTSQRTTSVAVTGTNLNPLPRFTLAPNRSPALELPKFALTMTSSLDGTSSSGTAVSIEDDFDQPASSHVRWTSTSAMAFDVTPGLLSEGVFNVTATNPDSQSAAVPNAIAAVRPPSVTSVVPKLLCDAQSDRQFVVTGTAFLRVGDATPTVTLSSETGSKTYAPVEIGGCVEIAKSVRTGLAQCTSMTIAIKQGDFDPGEVSVVVRNPDPAGCESSEPVRALITPPPSVGSVQPQAICDAQSAQQIVVTGQDFLQIGSTLPKVTLDDGLGTTREYVPTSMDGCAPLVTSVASDLALCQSITITLAQGDFSAGDISVKVENPDPAGCSSTEQVKFTVNPPPTLATVSPVTICQGGGVLTNITGTGFQTGASISLATTAATQVTITDAETASAAFQGAGVAFDPGTKYDLILKNPDSCEATIPQAVTAVVGPTILFADPPVAYNGITTQVTLYVTSFSAPLASIRIIPSGGGTATDVAATIDPNHSHRLLFTLPAGTTAGQYDVEIVDNTGCPATLSGGLSVTDQTTLVLNSVTPPFGRKNAPTAVTINAAGGLVATPRIYITPHTPSQGTVATGFSSVAFVSATELTAIVPAGLDPSGSPYDLVIVNPDGAVGVLANAYRSQVDPPPVIDSVSPGAVPTNSPPAITITGTNFRQPAVVFNCITDVLNNVVTPFNATVSTSSSTSIKINSPPVTTVPSPSLCRIRVTNGDDQSYVDFSAVAISNGSGNLSASKAGTALPSARRAPAVMSANATRAAHFLYVAGGDTGAAAGALNTVVTTTANDLGTGTSWFTQRYALNTARTQAGYVSLGRYLYVVGGNDGTGPVATVERAIVLDPLQTPTISDVDVIPDMTGLAGGSYSYRVAAVMDANDADNPGGETIPSDAQPILLPTLANGKKLQVSLIWTAVPGAVSYVVYRGPSYGQEEKIADVTDTTFVDTGIAPIVAAPAPLVLGSTGTWRQLPAMSVARESPAVAFGIDPSDSTKLYLYATFGRGASAALSSYEFLPVTVNASTGAQTLGAWTSGTQATAQARSQHSIYSATNENASFIPAGSNYIYLGGGTANGTAVIQILDVARVQAGGQLTAFSSAGTTIKTFGHGGILAANYLYTFGDDGPSASIRAGQISSIAAPSVNNVNNNGGGLITARYLPGVTLSGALIYVVGGSNVGQAGATTSVEWMIW